jgi:inhibitor of KinA sporulation pathway (predicted exonuclease)
MIKNQEIYLCFLDFEATCEDRSDIHEVIEFPSVLYKWSFAVPSKRSRPEFLPSSFEFISEFQQFVKPKNDSVLSEFCKNLTHIRQEQVDAGTSFPEAMSLHYQWLRVNIPEFETKTVYVVTCGNWDLKTMAPVEYQIHSMTRDDIPSVYLQFINIKKDFQALHKGDKKAARQGRSLAGMLSYYDLQFVGTPHSGIDDCRNIARIWEQMIKSGYYIKNLQKTIQKVPF